MSNNQKVKTAEEANRRIDKWRSGEEGQSMELHEYLGWTRDETINFTENGTMPDFELRAMNEQGLSSVLTTEVYRKGSSAFDDQ